MYVFTRPTKTTSEDTIEEREDSIICYLLLLMLSSALSFLLRFRVHRKLVIYWTRISMSISTYWMMQKWKNRVPVATMQIVFVLVVIIIPYGILDLLYFNSVYSMNCMLLKQRTQLNCTFSSRVSSTFIIIIEWWRKCGWWEEKWPH